MSQSICKPATVWISLSGTSLIHSQATEFGTISLWTYDYYHASTYGYYLEALVVFGRLTGRDPRSLGDHECSPFELGLSRQEASSLQQVAFDTLARTDGLTPAPFSLDNPASLTRCAN